MKASPLLPLPTQTHLLFGNPTSSFCCFPLPVNTPFFPISLYFPDYSFIFFPLIYIGIMQGTSTTSTFLLILPSLLFFSYFPNTANGDCWLIEGDKGYVWLAICSQNQPPYETIPQHINNTVHDLRLNENKLKAVLFSSMYRFTNLTDLNLTKNEINYIEDGAFAGQANLQVTRRWVLKCTRCIRSRVSNSSPRGPVFWKFYMCPCYNTPE